MSDLEQKLACLLASYEMDEPHVNSPGLDVGPEQKQHYPEFTPDQVREWLSVPHEGDCIRQCQPCRRCYMEAVAHKARWLAGRLV